MSTETNSRVDRMDRRMYLEAYEGKCSRCRPHRGENRRRSARKNRATK